MIFSPVSSTIFKILFGILIGIMSDKKKAVLIGPKSSGKTTFLQHIAIDEISNGPSKDPTTHKVKGTQFDEVTDFSGSETYFNIQNKYIKNKEYGILFFFDVSKYLQDRAYQYDLDSLIKSINFDSMTLKKMLIIGTHIDKLSGNYKEEIEHIFAKKLYKKMFKHIVYVDTTNKNCVEIINNALKGKV